VVVSFVFKCRPFGGILSRALPGVAGIIVLAGMLVDGYAIGRRKAAQNEFRTQVALANAEGERIRS